MSQLHTNLLKLLLTKKHLKISALKARKLRESLKKLHEDAAGQGQESQTCFGVPLHLQQQKTSSLTSSPVPHILETLTTYILSHASHEGILRKSGNERRAIALRDLMEDGNAQIPTDFEYSVHDVACVLKRWMRALPEPVIPNVLHEVFVKCVELESHHHRTQSLLMACLLMPTFHLNTLKHVALFLQELSKQESKNKMTSANLAKVLAPSLMPCTTKAETNPEAAKKFSDLSTTAVQVLIDHAQLIASLPPELEPLNKDSYKILSEDEFSDHGEPLVKRKLFTFLKPKHTSQKGIVRSSGPMRNSRKIIQVPNPSSKLVKRPTPPRVDVADVVSEFVDVPGQVEVRVTRSASKKRQLSAETVGRIRERRALRAIQNTRNQPSVRSLPTISGGKRRSVRRAATCRASQRADPKTEQPLRRPVANGIAKTADTTNSKSTIDSKQQQTTEENHSIVEMRKSTTKAISTTAAAAPSSADKETARKSFLAAMLGHFNQDNKETISEEVENHFQQSIVTTSNTSNGHDTIDGAEPGLDRHAVLRKPLMPSNRRALRRETPASKVTPSAPTSITVQL